MNSVSWLSLRRAATLAGIGLSVLLVAGVALFWASHAHGQRTGSAGKPAAIEIATKQLPSFQAGDPQRRQFGPLIFRGGLVMKSTNADFGGISSIRVEPGGERFLAISDRGMWLRGRLTYDGHAPSGVVEAEIAPMLAANGRPVSRSGIFDSESLAIDGGKAYVGFERVHRIMWFDYGKQGLAARGHPMRVPDAFKKLPSNQGIEALVAAPKGTPHAGALIALSERGLDEAGNIQGFIIAGSKHETFSVVRSDSFDITDAAVTPHGDLLILERSFSLLRGVRMRIRRVPMRTIAPGALVDGPVLIYADHGHQIDNMEGLSVHEDAAGELVLTVVSDDNFSRLQRSILLQFTLAEP